MEQQETEHILLFHPCNSNMHEDALFKKKIKFCTFLPFFWKFIHMSLPCRRGPVKLAQWGQLTKKVNLFLLVTLLKTTVLLHSYIKPNLEGEIRKITYVSDGCPDQNNTMTMYQFQTVCHHEGDFWVSCERVIFTKSRGTLPWEGIGGTKKD